MSSEELQVSISTRREISHWREVSNHCEISYLEVRNEEELPHWANVDTLASFLHHKMKPYHDTLDDVRRGLEYALSSEDGREGIAVLAGFDGRLLGAVVILQTGMGGYVPANLLLFVGVEDELRNLGIGRRLIERAISLCDGDIKLHVEPDNPAKRLYERIGFTCKYLEMRYQR